MLLTGCGLLPMAAGAQGVDRPAPRDTVGREVAADSLAEAAFQRAVRLVNRGDGATGRAVVDSVLQAVVPGSVAEATALRWHARVAATWDDAQRDYLRLMLEFEGTPLAGEAMLRLAQGELARGDEAAALRYLERMEREAPTAPARTEAAPLLARLRPAAPADSAPAPALADSVPPNAPTGPSRPAARGADARPAEAARASGWTVQLGAYATRAEAMALARRVVENQRDAHVDEVEGAFPFKVRFGRYPTRAAAELAAADYTRRTGAATFVTAAPPE